MKVHVKTLKGKDFHITLEATDTIGRFKALIEEQEGHPADLLKIIHNGKVLKDDTQTCADAKINKKDNDFVVCMITNRKKKASAAAAPAPKPAAPTPATPKPEAAPAPSPAPPPVPTATAPAPAPAGGSSIGDRSMLVTEDEREAVIKKFVEEMGFPEEAARAAMRAAFYNPDRATEYLLSGTTPAPSGGFDTTTTPAPAPAPSPAPAPAPTGSNGLSQMRNDPRLNQLRELLRRNPENLPLVLEQIGRQHPRLLQQIRDNRGEFIRMLNEPSPQVEVKNSQTRARQLLLPSFAAKRKEFAAQVGIAEEHFTGLLTHIQNIPQDALLRFIRLLVSAVPDGGRPPAGTITLTRSEEQSIIRLTEMGFSRSKAIEAFLACDKNEEMAANFLFDNP